MLKLYTATGGGGFNIGNEIDRLDVFTGDGSTRNFSLTFKTGLRVGQSIQSGGSTFFNRSGGGFTVAGNVVTLASAPSNSNKVCIPGMTGLLMQAFDQDVVPGVPQPRVTETPFYLVDIEEIATAYYTAIPSTAGITIDLVDNVASAGASASWFQFAPSLANGTVGTYGAAGAPIYTGNINTYSTINANSTSGATSLTVVDGTQFTAGDYIYVNPGQANAEVIRITAIVGNVLTISGCDFNHSIGEYAYTCGRKFFLKMTVPSNASGGVAVSFFDLAPRIIARKVIR